VSFKQAQQLGGNVRKGEKGSIAVFWKWNDAKGADGTIELDANGKPAPARRIPCLRYYNVWNVEQCDGLKHKRLTAWAKSEEERRRIEEERAAAIAAGTYHADDPQAPHEGADAVITGYTSNGGPQIVLDSADQRAYYRPSTDEVAMPARSLFKSRAAWYGTLFHEITHSTGIESRLARPSFLKGGLVAPFGPPEYAREELVAELGAAFLLGEVELPVEVDERAAYIAGWRKALSEDHRLITVAAGQAQKAAEAVLGRVLGGGRLGDEVHEGAGMEPESVEQVGAPVQMTLSDAQEAA
jgi:antirestriction protein ArdC